MLRINFEQTGEIIKRKCAEQLLDAVALAKRFHISTTTPYYWFYGKALPKWNVMINLCDILGCHIEDLLVIESEDEETGDVEVVPSKPVWRYDDDLKQALAGGKLLKYDEETDTFVILEGDDGK